MQPLAKTVSFRRRLDEGFRSFGDAHQDGAMLASEEKYGNDP
jgi:hypothetical protein